MKINNKYLNIPPYISTPWKNVTGLYMKGGVLVINLINNETVQIPGLETQAIQEIFSVHANYLDQEVVDASAEAKLGKLSAAAIPIEFSLESSQEQIEAFAKLGIHSFDDLTSAMQHNSALSFGPNLPQELLAKISSVIKVISPEAPLAIAPAETGCNCPHCQITRAIRGEGQMQQENTASLTQEEDFEPVTDEDLNFQQWKIQEVSDNLFSVVNKLDSNEVYRVFLGSPVGCTCGQQGCEHILAVLSS